ncbi:MAG: hypothetical protein ACLP36_08590 [Acidimicrobiales bacterium]|jgi:hypothetical protein
MDRSAIRMATKLLAKAESTDSDEEAVALAVRSYTLLAEAINAYDLTHEEPSGRRRRERRRLWDRRSVRRPPAEPAGTVPVVGEEPAVDGYVRLGNGGVQADHSVDLPL